MTREQLTAAAVALGTYLIVALIALGLWSVGHRGWAEYVALTIAATVLVAAIVWLLATPEGGAG